MFRTLLPLVSRSDEDFRIAVDEFSAVLAKQMILIDPRSAADIRVEYRDLPERQQQRVHDANINSPMGFAVAHLSVFDTVD